MTSGPADRGTPSSEVRADPLLSIVVAAIDAESLDAGLNSVAMATAHLPAEIVLVDASSNGGRHGTRELTSVRRLEASRDTLVPMLWAQGLHASRGRFVAFLNSQCLVGPEWATRMIAGVTSGIAGAGGSFTLGPHPCPACAALFFLRYSRFIEERWTRGTVHDIAGDNAIYRRSDLLECDVSETTGFWEVEAHRELRRRGLLLAGVIHGRSSRSNRCSPATSRFWRRGASARALRSSTWILSPIFPRCAALSRRRPCAWRRQSPGSRNDDTRQRVPLAVGRGPLKLRSISLTGNLHTQFRAAGHGTGPVVRGSPRFESGQPFGSSALTELHLQGVVPHPPRR